MNKTDNNRNQPFSRHFTQFPFIPIGGKRKKSEKA